MSGRGDSKPEGRRRSALAAVLVALVIGACATRPPAASSPTSPAPAGLPLDDASASASDEDAGDAEAARASADDAGAEASAAPGPCPADMVLVESATPAPLRFCIDTYEASLVEVLPDGSEQPFPHYMPVDGRDVRAVSRPHVFPQGYISEVQAQDACSASGKRLCEFDEWKTACMGPARTTFPYGDARRPGVCHDSGKSAVVAVFGAKAVAASTPYSAPAPTAAAPKSATGKRAHATKGRAAQASRPRATKPGTTPKTGPAKPPAKKSSRPAPARKSARPPSVDPGVWAHLNDPALGQVEGALSKTGEHEACVNGFGAVDMVGNLHEWVATDARTLHGTFAGGYYLDTSQNGDGCRYKTQAHAHEYHDYSTGFRCCGSADAPRQ